MKGCLLPDGMLIVRGFEGFDQETAMQRESKVTQMGADNHGKFSRVSARDTKGEIVWRQRLDHGDRQKLREPLKTWPTGVPVCWRGRSDGEG